MKIELTRELLERYLRATGWTLCVVNMEWHRTDDEGVVRTFPYGWTSDVGLVEGAVLGSLGFKLGLCAAAEHAIANIAHYPADVFYPLGNSVDCISARMAIHTSRALANDLLRAAGIEPDAWEAAK